jgi:hypothetical protein
MAMDSNIKLFASSLLVVSLLTACGKTSFQGSQNSKAKQQLNTTDKTDNPFGDANPNDPQTAENQSAALANVAVTESFKQIRASGTSGKPAYGVGLVSFKATGLAAGQKVLSINRTGMSADIGFHLCSTANQPTPLPAQNGVQLFEHTVDCFLIFKGIKNNPPVHRQYLGIKRTASVGTPTEARSFETVATLCVIPEGDTEPCVEKAGRNVAKDITGAKSISNYGYEAINFPATSEIEADLKSIPK